MTTGERIRKIRIEKGMTQEELAHKCGYMGKAVISKTEASKNGIKSDKLLKIANALGVSPSSLIVKKDTPLGQIEADKTAIYDFLLMADDESIHQLRIYADFLMNRK